MKRSRWRRSTPHAPARGANPRRLATFLALAVGTLSCASMASVQPDDITRTRFAPALGVNLAAMQRTASGAYLLDQITGDGDIAQPRQLVAVRYTGWLADGTKIDSSDGLEFRLGTGRVIRAWDDGIVGMRVGGIRVLVVPPELGYGYREVGGIPAGSVLVFHLNLLRIR